MQFSSGNFKAVWHGINKFSGKHSKENTHKKNSQVFRRSPRPGPLHSHGSGYSRTPYPSLSPGLRLSVHPWNEKLGPWGSLTIEAAQQRRKKQRYFCPQIPNFNKVKYFGQAKGKKKSISKYRFSIPLMIKNSSMNYMELGHKRMVKMTGNKSMESRL